MKNIFTLVLLLSFFSTGYSQLNADFVVDKSSRCTNNNFYFTDFSSSTNTITSWLWHFGDGDSSTVQNPNHSYQSAGSYIVNLEISDGISISSSNVQLIVQGNGTSANFTYSFTDQLTTNFNNTSGSTITNSTWYFGDQATANNVNENVSHTYAIPGIYDVCLAVTNNIGCVDSICETINTNLASLPENAELDNSQLFFPNPTSDFIFLNKSVDAPVEIIIYSASGQIIRTIASQNITSIDISDLPAGTYYLTYTNAENSSTEKIIKM